MPVVHLADRALIEVFGAEAEPFLQNILTTDLGTLGAGELKPGALLTPQGKILAAFLIARRGDGFVLDIPAVLGDELLRRLTLYKLRAKLEIRKLSPGLAAVGWDLEPTLTDAGSGLRDLRFGTRAVWRRYTDLPAATDSEAAWDLLRIGAAVGEIGVDYQPGEAFPHDVLLDQLGGVGFKKGCYIGQEVVSRMQHRGTARRRLLHVEAAAPLPPRGTEITADGRPLGQLGTVLGGKGLAIVRIDRVKDALDRGVPLSAGNVAVTLAIPGWATFTFPETAAGAEGA